MFDSYFNLTNKSNLIDRLLEYDLIRFFNYLVVSYFLGPPCKYKIFTRQHTHCARANFFSANVVKCWNSLPDCIDFSSFTRFKRINFTQFLRLLVCN